MWSDNAASTDFLNFAVLARVIAGAIEKNGNRPLSVGVSGAWGVGKSTTLELLATELEKQDPKPLIVHFQPWRHQTQDNVKAAFAECIARTLVEEEGLPEKVKKKAKSILKRANLIRIAGYGLGGALTLATGIPFGGLFARGVDAIANVADSDVTKDDAKKAVDFASETKDVLAHLFPEGEQSPSPYENIEKICKEFGETLKLLDRRLVVLIDDLDRCLPTTTIEALEAMRLYFFVPRTVFVVAADEEMLRMAVRKHFEVTEQSLDEAHLQSYYDKLIQLPFRIPSLTVPDVIVYMTLLVLHQQENLNPDALDEIRNNLCQLLGKTWDGTRISRESIMDFVDSDTVEDGFENRLSMIERLAPRMVGSKSIGGNPRLIKRFMNSLLVRQELAKAVNAPEETSEDVLAKILLLQRCGESALVKELEISVLESTDGRSPILGQLERSLFEVEDTAKENNGSEKSDEISSSESEQELAGHWSSEFAKEWIAMDPPLAEIDLRAAFHVSRGADQTFAVAVKLSQKSRELVEAIRDNPQIVDQLIEEIRAIPVDEVATVMNALVNQFRTASSDEFVPRLNCCVAFEKIHKSQSSLLVSTLCSISPRRFNPASIVAIRSRPWASKIEQDLQGKLDSKSPVMKSFKTKKKE